MLINSIELFKMAGTYDTEEQSFIDQIKCIAYRETRDAGTAFINQQCISEKVHRSIRIIM